MHNFRELKVWQKSMELATKVYEATLDFPSEEKFGIISQIQRSAVSIPSNIAEGAGRGHNKEFSRFLGIAGGSAFELETQLILANRLNYLSKRDFNQLEGEVIIVQKMIFALKKALK